MQTFVLTVVNASLQFCWSVCLPLKAITGEVGRCSCTARVGDSSVWLGNDVSLMAVLVLCLVTVDDDVEEVLLLQ